MLFFGLYTPLAKHWLTGLSPLFSSGLLYLSAGTSLLSVRVGRYLLGYRVPIGRKLKGPDIRIYGFGACCGASASALQLFGLQHVSGTAGSLLSNLEGVFTLGIALCLGDSLGRLELGGALAILAGAIVLSLGSRGGPATEIVGVAAIAVACLGWAIDNTTTQRLSDRDPFALMASKCLLAGTLSLALAAATHCPLPPVRPMLWAAAIGAIWWAGGMLCFALGMRALGAARMGSMLSLTPFAGAVGSIVGLAEPITMPVVASGALMALGAFALARGHLDQPALVASSTESSTEPSTAIVTPLPTGSAPPPPP